MTAPKPDTPLQKSFRALAESTPGAHLVETEDKDGARFLMPWVPYGEGFEVPLFFEYDGDADDNPFAWTMAVAYFEGRLQCVGFRASAVDPRQPISADLLHRFPLGRLLEEAALVASRPADQVPRKFVMWTDVDEARAAHRAVAKHHHRKPASRRALTDEMLAEVAAVYRRNPVKPSKAVAEHFHYSPTSARRVVSEARRRGFLGPAHPGRGGEQSKEDSDA